MQKLIGLDEKINLFISKIKNNTLKQSYCFYGDPHIGKSLFARSLAYYLEYQVFDLLNKPLIDFFEINPENNSIGIDVIKSIKKFIYQKPLKSNYRYVLINDAFLLTIEAQGALLKIMEEPPRSALIILVTPTYENLSSPLISRLIKIYFNRLSNDTIKQILIKNYQLDKQQAEVIAKNSFGRIGRAIKLLEDHKTNIANDLINNLDELIVQLFLKNKMQYSSLIKWLLNKQYNLANFNLNTNLQIKAIQIKLQQYNLLNFNF
ncbi:MAG: AAA family ATPase [Minisyncoccia bacterium]